MAVYDINGNVVSSGGSDDNFDTLQVNLINPSTNIVYGYRNAGNGTPYADSNACYFEIPVVYGKTYYCNILRTPVATYDGVALIAAGQTSYSLVGYDSNGTVVSNGVSSEQVITRHEGSTAHYRNYQTITIASSSVVKIRLFESIAYSLTVHNNIDGMFSEQYDYPNINTLGVEYLDRQYGNDLTIMKPSPYLGLMEQMIDDQTGKVDDIIDTNAVIRSPLNGKRIVFLGDSNMQYKMGQITTYFETYYNAKVSSYAKAGVTWEQADGDETATDFSGVGQVNQVCRDYYNSESPTILNDDIDVIIIMLGTNCNSVGTPITSEGDLTTLVGAMDWGLKKLSYYARNKKIGVMNVPRTNDTAERLALNSDTGEYYVVQGEGTKQKYVRAYAQKYCLPLFETSLMGRMIADATTREYAQQNYYFGDGVHLGTWCWEHLLPSMASWIAFEVVGYGTGNPSTV